MSQIGIRAINISWATGCTPNQYEESIIEEIYENGSILIAAAGNGSTCGGPANLVYPSAYDRVISVTSIGENDNHEQIFGDSNSTHQHNSTVDLCAPGYNVPLSIAPGFYMTSDGTSFAAPLVTGTIGLMLSIKPCLSFEEIREILRISSDDIYALNPSYVNLLGSGRLNSGEALRLTEMYKCGAGFETFEPSLFSPCNSVSSNATNSTKDLIHLSDHALREIDNIMNSRPSSESPNSIPAPLIAEVNLHPNPSLESATLYSNISAPMKLVIFNMHGSIVETHDLPSGKNNMSISLNQKGVYTLKIINNNRQAWFRRFIKL
jgi:hypothetical protein